MNGNAYLGRSCAVIGVGLMLAAGCERGGASPGQRIYDDGVGLDGPIEYTQGPDWFRFADSGCAICHGGRGQGLVVKTGGVTGAAPAVTWDALASRGYDEATLRSTLTGGIDPHGRELHYYMPRWVLSDAEFAALVTYLQSL